MKISVVYLLIFCVSFAFNFETIEYFSNALGNSISWMEEFHCEERTAEAEESSEKSEKLKISEYLNSNHHFIIGLIEPSRFSSNQNIDFSSSDYSQVVYSPPEFI